MGMIPHGQRPGAGISKTMFDLPAGGERDQQSLKTLFPDNIARASARTKNLDSGHFEDAAENFNLL